MLTKPMGYFDRLICHCKNTYSDIKGWKIFIQQIRKKVSACPDVILWEAGKNSYLAKKQWHAVKNGIDWWKTYKAFTQGGWKCSHVNFIQRWIKCKIALKWKRVVFICHSFLCSQTWVLFLFDSSKVFGSDNIHIFVISMKNLHFISKHDLHFNGNTEKEIVDYIKNKPVS